MTDGNGRGATGQLGRAPRREWWRSPTSAGVGARVATGRAVSVDVPQFRTISLYHASDSRASRATRGAECRPAAHEDVRAMVFQANRASLTPRLAFHSIRATIHFDRLYLKGSGRSPPRLLIVPSEHSGSDPNR